jgi:hypothetical protein
MTLPPTVDFLKILEVDFSVAESVACGESIDVGYVNGLRGTGFLPINNAIAVRNQTIGFPELRSVNCTVEIVAEAMFHRGDCNFDADPESGFPAVTLADASAIIGQLFLPRDEGFDPPCLDACDANDDARLDLSDAVKILRYLFLAGESSPAPGAVVSGEDPTEDDLTCDAGRDCQP